MKATVYNALLGQESNNSILAFNCPTSNCTFEPFRTLAFCSKCEDISTNVKFNCQGTCQVSGDSSTEETFEEPCNAPIQPQLRGNISDYTGYFSMQCNYSLLPRESSSQMGTPNLQLSLNSTYAYTLTVPPQAYSYHGYNMTSVAFYGRDLVDNESDTSTSFLGVGNPLLVLGRAFLNESSPLPSSPAGTKIVPNVAACALYMCVQTLNTTIYNGRLHQEIISSWRNDTPPTYEAYLPLVNILDTDSVSYFNVPAEENDTATAQNLSFSVDNYAPYELLDILQQTLQSTALVSQFADSPISPPVFDSDLGPTFSSTADLNSFMDPVAARLTDWLRMQSTDKPATGTAYQVEPTWPSNGLGSSCPLL